MWAFNTGSDILMIDLIIVCCDLKILAKLFNGVNFMMYNVPCIICNKSHVRVSIILLFSGKMNF